MLKKFPSLPAITLLYTFSSAAPTSYLTFLFLLGEENEDEGGCSPALHDLNMRSSEM